MTTGSLICTPSPEPLSIVTVEYQTVGRAADHPRGDRRVAGEGALAVEAEQLAQLLVLALGALRLGELVAQLLDLGLQVAVLRRAP